MGASLICTASQLYEVGRVVGDCFESRVRSAITRGEYQINQSTIL